jgi:hypothetical protein
LTAFISIVFCRISLASTVFFFQQAPGLKQSMQPLLHWLHASAIFSALTLAKAWMARVCV